MHKFLLHTKNGVLSLIGGISVSRYLAKKMLTMYNYIRCKTASSATVCVKTYFPLRIFSIGVFQCIEGLKVQTCRDGSETRAKYSDPAVLCITYNSM